MKSSDGFHGFEPSRAGRSLAPGQRLLWPPRVIAFVSCWRSSSGTSLSCAPIAANALAVVATRLAEPFAS